MAQGDIKSFWYAITHPKNVTKEDYIRNVRKVTNVIIAGFVLSLIIFVIVAFIGGWNNVSRMIETANLSIYALAFVAAFLGYLCSFGKWRYFMKVLGLKVSLKDNLAVYLSLYSMDLTPGKIGRVVTAYTLHRITNIRLINIAPIVTADIFTDFLGLAAVALGAALYFNQYVIPVLIADIVLILPFLFFVHDWFYKIMKKYLVKNPEQHKIFSIYGHEYFSSQKKLNKLHVYAVSMAFTIPSAILYTFALYFSLLALGVPIGVGPSVLAYSVSQVFGSITGVIPGGGGVVEATIITVLGSTFHQSAAISSAATIMTRAASLWFGLLIGGIFLLYTLRYWNLKPGELARKMQKNKK